MQFIFQKKSLILAILFFLATILILFFLNQRLNDNKENINLARERWQAEELKRNNLTSLLDSIKKIEPELVELEKHFIHSSDVVPFLDLLESLAEKIGTKAELISIDASTDSSSLQVNMQVSGTFENIYRLILLIENSPYHLEFILADLKNKDREIISTNSNAKISEWSAVFQIKLLSFIN